MNQDIANLHFLCMDKDLIDFPTTLHMTTYYCPEYIVQFQSFYHHHQQYSIQIHISDRVIFLARSMSLGEPFLLIILQVLLC